ncbi:MAG: ornithine cyclodeaminase family protein [Candidatus Aquicultorales bacterium]
MRSLILSARDMRRLLTFEAAVDAVEKAFAATAGEDVAMPPKLYLNPPGGEGDFRAMPAYLSGMAGLKWVSVYPGNPAKDLPTVMAVFILNDPRTGYPLAVMDATALTDYRTGAAAAVAVKHLARPDARTLGMVGAGAQAFNVARATRTVRPFATTIVWSLDPKIPWLGRIPGATPGSLEEASGCDIVCTTTPSRKPLVKAEWLSRGSLIVAIGADAPGKQEVDDAVLREAKVVVDDVRQASHAGEINVPVSKGAYDPASIHATIGEVVAGRKPGREGEEILLFDSTGIAVQDIALGAAVYEEAKRQGLGFKIELT